MPFDRMVNRRPSSRRKTIRRNGIGSRGRCFGQLGGLSSLREVETVWNAQAAHQERWCLGHARR
jgi:hypothetical protein